MDMQTYQKEYDELYRGVGKEDKVSMEPKHSYLEALARVGPTNAEMVREVIWMMKGHTVTYDKMAVMEKYEKYKANKEMFVAAVGSSVKKSEGQMIEFVKRDPRAYLYVHPSINNEQFRRLLVCANPSVYLLLTEEQRKEPGLLDAYRDGLCSFGNSLPNRCIDPTEYYSISAFKEKYSEWVKSGGHDIGLSRFLTMAEKVNPELQVQYDQAKREALLELADSLGRLVYPSNLFEFGPIMNEVEKHCPELNQTVLKEYREQNKDNLIKSAFRCAEGMVTGGWKELQEDLLQRPETRDVASDAIATQLNVTTRPNSTYAIDQTSVYAQIAKGALMHFKGLTEREAVAVIRNSTYDQIESQVPIRKTISDAVWAIGTTLGLKKANIKHFEGKLIDARVSRPSTIFYGDGIPDAVQNLKSSREPGSDQLLDKCSVDAIVAINGNRAISSVDLEQQPSVEQIKAIEMRDDMVFVGPIFDALQLQIDERVVAQVYDSQIDYAEKYKWLNDRSRVDQLVELIGNDPGAVVAALEEMGLSTADLVRMIERESNYDMSQFKEPQHVDEREKDMKKIDKDVEMQTPGNRD